MLKKFLAGVFVLLMICAQASAMRLELFPRPIGKIFFTDGKFSVEGASKLSKHRAMFGDKIYPRTEADQKRYGTSGGDKFYGEKIFFHFDAAKNLSRFGDRDKKNSVPVDTFHGETEIFIVNNSAGRNLFLLRQESGTGDAIKVLGLRGGKWIEQLDVPTLRAKYDIGRNFSTEKFFTEENRIIFRYRLQERVVDLICRWHAVNEKFYTEAIER